MLPFHLQSVTALRDYRNTVKGIAPQVGEISADSGAAPLPEGGWLICLYYCRCALLPLKLRPPVMLASRVGSLAGANQSSFQPGVLPPPRLSVEINRRASDAAIGVSV